MTSMKTLLALAALAPALAIAAGHGPLPAGHDDATYYDEDEAPAEPNHLAQRIDDASMSVDERVSTDATARGADAPAGYDAATMEPAER